MSEERREGRRYDMSPREAQLLEMAANGLTDAGIAYKLGISEATVGTYWGRVRIKLGPYSRTELVSIVLRHQQEAAVRKLREESEGILKELREKLETSRDDAQLFAQIIDNAPDAILLVSGDGFVKQANMRAHELFGYAEGEMSTISLLDLIPERLREAHKVHREVYVQAPNRRAMGEHLQTPAVRKDGAEFLVRATLSAITTPHGLFVTCVLRDVATVKSEG